MAAACSSTIQSSPPIVIRVNQVGFEPDAPKNAIILSKFNLQDKYFEILDSQSHKSLMKTKLGFSTGPYANFPFSYSIDFSDFFTEGKYLVSVNDFFSPGFEIKKGPYKNIVNSLLTFFKVQRCGYTDPYLHEICHKADVTHLIENGIRIDTTVDVTGGWHDAGDYVKFLNTTAYATYTLLFAYEFNPDFFNFDDNNDDVPDILEEAKIGLDWLLRCNFDKYKLITQVQDLRDHEVGWRLPENDTLQFDRPGFVGIGKNLIGIYSATLAMGSRIWRQKFMADDFADNCLTAAENIYSLRITAPDIDSSTTGVYQDNSFWGKLALGAVELYKTTNRPDLLKDAKSYADSSGPDFWWSYGEITDYAFYRLSEYDKKYTDLIEASLKHFVKNMNKNLFRQSADLYWGSNNTTLGIALKNILWKRITGSKKYDELSANQINYILGQNPWGISFISGVGQNFSKKLHHQISKILKKELTGGFAAGPVKKSILQSYNIPYSGIDKFKDYQTDEAFYRDDFNDYITNEPTISANATGIFVFGSF